MANLYVPEEEEIWYYRGVHGAHPALAAARNGIVFPGKRDGSITAEQHNLGPDHLLVDSPYTSWTTTLWVAEAHASKVPGGVVLRARALPHRGPGWSWERSEDFHDENEVLLLGVRLDVEVMQR